MHAVLCVSASASFPPVCSLSVPLVIKRGDLMLFGLTIAAPAAATSMPGLTVRALPATHTHAHKQTHRVRSVFTSASVDPNIQLRRSISAVARRCRTSPTYPAAARSNQFPRTKHLTKMLSSPHGACAAFKDTAAKHELFQCPNVTVTSDDKRFKRFHRTQCKTC